MTPFQPGFASRHAAAPAMLERAFYPPSGFEPTDLTARGRPRGYAPRPDGGPRHFTPLNPDSNPTEGWDPLAPTIDHPIAAARAAGYAAGLADAGRDRALAEALTVALEKGMGLDRERLARRLRQTVLLLVGRLVGEVGVSPEWLGDRITAAVEALATSADGDVLRVHPDDVALLDGRLPDTLVALGDAQIARGSFVIESAATIVEDGPDRWLEQLADAIDRVAPPIC